MASAEKTSSPLLSISKTRGEWVAPCKPTSEGIMLPLSWMDKDLCTLYVGALLVYKPVEKEGKEEGSVLKLRQALAEALVPFSPVAGWIAEERGEVAVHCSGRGAWFVIASVACTLKDIDYLHSPGMEGDENLVPCPPEDCPHPPLLTMQVTQFSCGGTVVGFTFNHGLMDGLGVGMFLNTISTFLRGGNLESVTNPIWCRDKIPTPLKLKDAVDYKYGSKPLIMDLHSSEILTVKDSFRDLTGSSCTTFEVVAALAWRARARTMMKTIHPNTMIRLLFFMDARSLLQSFLPNARECYYGNALYYADVIQSNNVIAHASITTIVTFVQQAKQGFPKDIHSFISGPSDPSQFTIEPATFLITDWRRIGFNGLYYPSSQLIHFRPLSRNRSAPHCFILPSPHQACAARIFVAYGMDEEVNDFSHEISAA